MERLTVEGGKREKETEQDISRRERLVAEREEIGARDRQRGRQRERRVSSQPGWNQVEARGRPALVPGESPASVITSSPILSNSGRTPLVLLVLHLLSRAHLAPLAFQPHPSPLPPVSSFLCPLYHFRQRFLSSPLSLLFLRVILRFHSARNSFSFVSFLFHNFPRTRFPRVLIVHAKNCSILRQ